MEASYPMIRVDGTKGPTWIAGKVTAVYGHVVGDGTMPIRTELLNGDITTNISNNKPIMGIGRTDDGDSDKKDGSGPTMELVPKMDDDLSKALFGYQHKVIPLPLNVTPDKAELDYGYEFHTSPCKLLVIPDFIKKSKSTNPYDPRCEYYLKGMALKESVAFLELLNCVNVNLEPRHPGHREIRHQFFDILKHVGASLYFLIEVLASLDPENDNHQRWNARNVRKLLSALDEFKVSFDWLDQTQNDLYLKKCYICV